MDAHDAATDTRSEAINELLRACARMLLDDDDVARFLDRLAFAGPIQYQELFDDHGEAELEHQARFFRSFGWSVAANMPLPAHGFRPRKLVPPGRNEPCLCGSGAKFKQCCGPGFERLPPLEPEGLAALVIDEMPRKAWATLPGTRVAPRMVGAAAVAMLDDQRAADACKLLEPWAALPPPWPAARADLLDLLLDVYLELGKPRKRKQLAQAMVAHGDPLVQSIGWQRLAMIAADKGDAGASQAAFERAMRLTPNDPRVAVLEVTLLWGRREPERARERAAFHARRLARLPPDVDLQGSIDALERMARGEMPLPPGLDGADEVPFELPFGALTAWAEKWPAPALRLDLAAATAADLAALRPDARLAAALQAWRQAFAWQAPRMAWEQVDAHALQVFEDTRWLPLLRGKPMLADSFEVLDGLLLALDLVPPALVSELRARLLYRALELWTLLRERFPRARCEWAHLDNRPALRLLARRIELDASPRAEHSFDWLQAMVETLNPHDNHGFRERLAAVYLRRGQHAQALALCERYPDDFVGLQLLHTRALLAAQRLPQAAAQLQIALATNAHVLPLLLSPRKPREPNVSSYSVGSPEQARLAVAAQHDLWGKDKAVRAWLQAAAADGPASPSLFDRPVELTLT